MAPPERGLFEVVNKSKFENEIIGVIASGSIADVALKKRRDVAGHLVALRGGLLPCQTVLHGAFGDDVEVLEVAVFYGCKAANIEELHQCEAVEDLRERFRHVKAYRVPCKGKNVLLKFKDGGGGSGGAGLELQRGEASSLPFMAKKKRSVGGGIDMKTNAEFLESVYR